MKREDIESAAKNRAPSVYITLTNFAIEQINAALEEAAAQLEFADPESDLDDLADEVIRALKIE